MQRAGAGALRNVVYQSSENKMEVKENDGLTTILYALKNSRDVETRRQLTGPFCSFHISASMTFKRQPCRCVLMKHFSNCLSGLLWNLSSHDLLKERLSREALTILTQSVLVPSSGIAEGDNPKDDLLADADVFHSVTGCLR